MDTVSNSRGDSKAEFLDALKQDRVSLEVVQGFRRLLLRMDSGELEMENVCTLFDVSRGLYDLDCWSRSPDERSPRPWAAFARRRGVLALLHVRGAFTGGTAERAASRSEARARFDLEFPAP